MPQDADGLISEGVRQPGRRVRVHKVALQRRPSELVEEVAVVDGDPRTNVVRRAGEPRGDLLRPDWLEHGAHRRGTDAVDVQAGQHLTKLLLQVCLATPISGQYNLAAVRKTGAQQWQRSEGSRRY